MSKNISLGLCKNGIVLHQKLNLNVQVSLFWTDLFQSLKATFPHIQYNFKMFTEPLPNY